jgi:apolipoprotein N-acyltransferase
MGALVSGWLTYVLLAQRRYTKYEKGWRWLQLSTLSAGLFYLGFPMMPFTPLLFIAFVPLLIIEKEISDGSTTTQKGQLHRYVYHAFVLWNMLSTWWVANSALIPGLIANTLNAFFMAMPFLLFHQTKKKLGQTFGYISLVCYWLSWEYLHLSWEISWPWLTLGNAFAQYPSWVQWYSVTGVFGGGLWILLGNLFFFRLYLGLKAQNVPFSDLKMLFSAVAKKDWWTMLGLFLLPILFSLVLYYNYQEQGEKIEVVAIQPNYEPHYRKFAVPETQQLRQFMSLIVPQVTDSTDFVVLPETSFGMYNLAEARDEPSIKTLHTLCKKFPRLNIILGLDAYRVLSAEETPTPNSRKSNQGFYWEAYNAATQLTSDSSALPIYKKSKLVTGPELLPFRKFFFFLVPLLQRFGGTVEGLGTQPERSVFQHSNKKEVKIAPVICFESIYGEYCRGYVQKGANALFIMTNDGWWDDSPGFRQHAAFASLRAIELRRSIARAANSGKSCFVNQRGDVSFGTLYDTPTAIKSTITLNETTTLYVILGDVIAYLAIVGTGALVLFLIKKML